MKRPEWKIRQMFANARAAFAYVGDQMTSPQRKVTRIAKEHSNGCYPIPVSWLELECGHTTRAITRSDDYALAHSDANHLAGIGAVLGCVDCRTYQRKLEDLKALKPGDVQHSRFRTRDSRGFGKGDYYVYQRDTRSPTGVRLLMSIEATPEADRLLRTLAASPLSPTEAR